MQFATCFNLTGYHWVKNYKIYQRKVNVLLFSRKTSLHYKNVSVISNAIFTMLNKLIFYPALYAIGRYKFLPCCRNWGLTLSANFISKLSVSSMMWSAEFGTSKSSRICFLLMNQDALIAMRRHLDVSIFWKCLQITDLQVGQV